MRKNDSELRIFKFDLLKVPTRFIFISEKMMMNWNIFITSTNVDDTDRKKTHIAQLRI